MPASQNESFRLLKRDLINDSMLIGFVMLFMKCPNGDDIKYRFLSLTTISLSDCFCVKMKCSDIKFRFYYKKKIINRARVIEEDSMKRK